MASERQIAANRCNAAKSTGPRSSAAKRRVGRNAIRHGLNSKSVWNKGVQEELDKRTRRLLGDSQHPNALDRARAVAEAELEIARARQAKILLINRISIFGGLNPPQYTVRGISCWMKAYERGFDRPLSYAMEGFSAPMPPEEPERSAEAIRRALPELRKLDRYEKRAAARRDRAVQELCDATKNG